MGKFIEEFNAHVAREKAKTPEQKKEDALLLLKLHDKIGEIDSEGQPTKEVKELINEIYKKDLMVFPAGNGFSFPSVYEIKKRIKMAIEKRGFSIDTLQKEL